MCQFNRYRIPNLTCDLKFTAAPLKLVWKPLKPSRLVVSDRPVPVGMQVATLFRFEELCANSDRRSIPMHASHHVQGALVVSEPTGRLEMVRKIEAVAAGRDVTEALK